MKRNRKAGKTKKYINLLLVSVMVISMCGASGMDVVQGAMLEEQNISTLASEGAAGIPGKPLLQHNQYGGDTDGEYTITVNMWYGNNATSYVLYEKCGKLGEYKPVATGQLTDDTPNPQLFTVDITGRTKSGTYYYYVVLMNEFGSTSSDEISLSVGSTTASKLTLDKIDANEVVNQYVMEQGTDTFRIDYMDAENPEYIVTSSNTSVVKADIINGNELRLEAVNGGRSGIRLEEKQSGEIRYFGVRVREADGTLAEQPSYLAIGQVSEDSEADLKFWQSISEDDTNKRMDIRYIYINGGPVNGWRSWSGNDPEKRVKSYIIESLKLGMVPYFVYYNIPDGSESYDVDYQHINDKEYMKAYYEDLIFFLETCAKYDEGEQVGIILEPDFLGYMMQNGTQPPQSTPAAGVESVYTANILKKGVDPDFPNTLTGLVESINYIISTRYPSAVFGWQFNTWGFQGAPSKGIMHATETMGMQDGRTLIERAATETAQFYIDAGILKHGADFISIDKYGLDGAYQDGAAENPEDSSWLWNSDMWNNYLFYTKILHEKTGFPVTLWQIPVGHLNHSLESNPYDGGTFPDLKNTEQHYEDSAPTFFFGDTFEPGSDARMEYFSRNACNDSKVHVNGNTITYDSHMEEAKAAGITCILFGAGVGSSTDAVGAPPTDSYWWITKAQRYYQNPVSLDEVTLTLSSTQGTLKKGETVTLTAIASPEMTPIIWSSQNPVVATVKDGVVTAVGSGTTIIYAKAGSVTKEYKLTVIAESEEVSKDTDGTTEVEGSTETPGSTEKTTEVEGSTEAPGSTEKTTEVEGSTETPGSTEKTTEVEGDIETSGGGGQSDEGKTGNVTSSNESRSGYKITYYLNGGINSGKNPDSYYGENVTLYAPARKGYEFAGWFLDSGYRTQIVFITSTSTGDYTLYAKWKKITVKKTAIRKITRSRKGRITVKMKKRNGVDGYEIICARDKAFKKEKKVVSGKKTALTVKQLKSKKIYYVKVRAYKLDSAGQKVYSKYSKAKKVVVK